MIATLVLCSYPNTTCKENEFLRGILARFETPTKMVCQIPQNGLQSAYEHLMQIGFSSLTNNMSALENICFPVFWRQVS